MGAILVPLVLCQQDFSATHQIQFPGADSLHYLSLAIALAMLESFLHVLCIIYTSSMVTARTNCLNPKLAMIDLHLSALVPGGLGCGLAKWNA